MKLLFFDDFKLGVLHGDSVVDVSHHSFAGRITSPLSSSGTNPCCCPLTPIAFTSAAIARAKASTRA